MVRLVQITNRSERRVALVREPHLKVLSGVESVYALAQECVREDLSLTRGVEELATGESLVYDDVYAGSGGWRLMSPVDVPGAPERMLVSGTGLTHLGSAKDRQAMHLQKTNQADKPITDSMRMFEAGLKGGRPAKGEIGVAPEWFYKGDGSILRAPFHALEVPSHGEDGGEEAEIAGVYVIAEDGTPVRVGMCAGNEFSDHVFEKRNYLNLAGSKLRPCAIGPELVIGAEFQDVRGHVQLERAARVIWQKEIASGEENMAHSLSNLEHHHFKFEGHQKPGHLHVHFFGAHSLSFGEGIKLEEGDVMQVQFEGYGRPLRNPVRVGGKTEDRRVQVRALS